MDQTASGSSFIDVVIIGNGPSAMILSYILHGNIPFYNPEYPHPDPILHTKLKDATELLHLDVDRLTNHFEASRFSYSTQSLPVNSLIDALVRPHGETDDLEDNTCIQWRHDPAKQVRHVAFGKATQPGGQWTECPPGTSQDVQALSYAGMLSLPGYGFREHYQVHHGSQLSSYTRPSRGDIAEYLAAYPEAVGINDSIKNSQTVWGVSRTEDGFYIGSHNIHCKHIVLASGNFTEVKPARPLLQPLLDITDKQIIPLEEKPPLLVIGSGFSAADVITSANKDQKIIHIYKWEPETKPSPLKSCHQQAYPEYAGIYRFMKQVALANQRDDDTHSQGKPPLLRSTKLTPFLQSRNWQDIYEGFPNTLVTDVSLEETGTAVVTLRRQDGTTLKRQVCGLSYAVGRRGSLKYLDHSLRREVLAGDWEDNDNALVGKDTFRAVALRDLQVTKDVFIIGSLTGDSLVRFAYGGCVSVAGKLIQPNEAKKLQPPDEMVSGKVSGQSSIEEKTIANDGDTHYSNNDCYITKTPHLESHPAVGETKEKSKKSWWHFFLSLGD